MQTQQPKRLVPQLGVDVSTTSGHSPPSEAPWYIVPANHKWYRNYVVANALVKALSKLDLKLPKTDVNATLLKKM